MNRELNNIEKDVASLNFYGLNNSYREKIVNDCTDYWIPNYLRIKLEDFYNKKLSSFKNFTRNFYLNTIKIIVEDELKKIKKPDTYPEEGYFKERISMLILRCKEGGELYGEMEYDAESVMEIKEIFKKMKDYYDFDSKDIKNHVQFISFIKNIIKNTEQDRIMLEELHKKREELIKEIEEIKNNIRTETKIKFVYAGLKE